MNRAVAEAWLIGELGKGEGEWAELAFKGALGHAYRGLLSYTAHAHRLTEWSSVVGFWADQVFA